MMYRKKQGFTLIELMIVVAIIGILASLVTVRYQIFVKKTRQLEVKGNLQTIRMMQTTYFAESSKYINNLNVTCTDPVTCQNRLSLNRGNASYYDDTATKTSCHLAISTNPASNNYQRAELGFRVPDCTKTRYVYYSNGYYHVAREIAASLTSSERKVFPGCSARRDTWVLTESNELRHSGTRSIDQSPQRTENGHNTDSLCD